MLNELISIITSTGVTLQEFCYLSIIVYIFSKPVILLVKKFFKGVNL